MAAYLLATFRSKKDKQKIIRDICKKTKTAVIRKKHLKTKIYFQKKNYALRSNKKSKQKLDSGENKILKIFIFIK